ncbi:MULTISPECIES: sodium:solute symporter family protein [Clostridium]|uniref:Predicted sodium:solute symporter n=5 Tax=Clostridium TaxID=1485 RepID=D8GRG5_CLOLD|nr:MULTISPECIES: sodium:solute symporter family protein [Clostridium]ADK16333.1 predicted sodium:solute symporter [Clostridium ljungdahlii DSM 13528]AGY75410.1 sodium:solute symporter family protein [Clostridium autoethanogenum DSM 10061]ALU35576.1 Na(+)/solute symporter [Clostridium autoethanogenum DSM 10061]OAA89793.1 Sodium/pantothenate symporter [Clostridium ljungdahlii DSM 13528]OAA94684.1 Sodium/pantothenate symporter [Clostridium coskatii]
MLLSSFDNVVIILCSILLIFIGWYFSRAVKDMESFYLGNRSLPWSLTVGALVATWYGGVGTIGTVEYSAMYGLSVWVIWCVTSHLGRMPLALWVGPKIHIRTDITVPDLLESAYGKGVAVLGAILMLTYCTQIGQLTSFGFIGKVAWGINNFTAGIVCIVMVIVIAVLGGLMGVAVTDMLMFWCMCFGLTMVLPGQWDSVGGWAGLQHALSKTPALMDPLGGLTPMKALMLCVLSFGVYADPTFYQRFSASDSPKSGRRALLSCFVLWVCFDIVLTLTGLIVKVRYPNMVPGEGYIKLVLGSLPQGVRALFIIGLAGSIISALDGYYLSGGATLANDIYGRIKGNVTQDKLVLLTRIGIIIESVAALSIAFKFTTAQDAFIFVSSIWMAAGFVPIVGGLVWKGKKTALGGYLGILVGGFAFAYFKLFPIKAFNVEALVVALPLSLIAWILGNKFGKSIPEKVAKEVV